MILSIKHLYHKTGKMNTKYFVGFAFWLLPFILSAQLAGNGLQSPENQFPEQRNGKWVVDSTWFYLGNTFGQYWFNNEQYRVTGRDQYGNFKNSITRQFDTISLAWTDKSRNSADYYDSVTNQKWIAEIWDANGDRWVMSDSIFYNESGSPEISWYKIWSPVKFRFSGGKRIDYNYSETGQLLHENIQLFDTLGGNWKNGQIASYMYNPEGLVLQKLLITWDISGFWRDSLRVSYSYNGEKLLVETIHEIKNQSDQWENWWKWSYNYNSSGKIREEYQYGWDGIDWKNKIFTLYTYDNLLLIQALRKIWDENELTWIDKNRTTYSYNPNGQRTEVMGEYFDHFGNIWYRSYTYSYSYDEHGNRNGYLYRIWDELNGIWLNFYKDENYWSEFSPFSVNELNVLNVNIFPNPATGEINIQLDENITNGICYLTSCDGKILFTTSFSGNFINLSTQTIEPGIYLLTLDSRVGVLSQKIIIGK